MHIDTRPPGRPFFSICVPQFNRTSFLIEACRALAAQRFRDFELCISDDCSTDGRAGELLAFLRGSGLPFVYRRQERNTRYDGNLRASIALARGRYCLLMGNDDCLAGPDTLAELHAELVARPGAKVALANYEEWAGGRLYRRVRAGPLGAGPLAAARAFRSFSFVSGVIIDREVAQALQSARWDGSEMYQMYVACRAIAEGGELLGIERVAVRKDIQIAGEAVESYASQARREDRRIVERRLPLAALGRVVVDAVAGPLGRRERERAATWVFLQILLFTYPYWIVEYRRVHSWQYALGVCLGMRPRHLLRGVGLGRARRALLVGVYGAVTLAGLLVPERLFRALHGRLYALAKSL